MTVKRKLFMTLALTIGFSGIVYASSEPVRAMIAPALSHNTVLSHLKQNQEQVISTVKKVTSRAIGQNAIDPAEQKTIHHPTTTTGSNQAQSGANKTVAAQPATNHTTTASNPTTTSKPTTPPAKPQQPNLNIPVTLRVPAQDQNPELYNGCEVTSLSMMLSAAGHPVDKMTLANDIPKDTTPETHNSDGSIASWGDPNNGFVGDITGANSGYGVYHGPVTRLLNNILPGRAKDLTGGSFTNVMATVASGHPVMVWTTANFTPTSNWTTWQGPNGPVRVTFDEHCVLVVGFNISQVIINDPLDGTAAKTVDKANFVSAWQQLGNQAVTYTN